MKQELEIKDQVKTILEAVKKFSPEESVELRIPLSQLFNALQELRIGVGHFQAWWK